jgi:hypothetical protein
MKLWHFVVAGLYVLVLAVLTIPLLLVGPWSHAELLGIYGEWPYWLWLAVMGGCQLLLLLVPVQVANRRPVSRGALWPTVALGALMLALLALGAALSLYAAVFGDNESIFMPSWSLLVLTLALWGLWGIVFHRLSRTQAPMDFVGIVCQRLVRGSILELLVAIPCHIVVRCREYCCAGMFTMFGLAMGVSVMLFAFGPAVYFLYVARTRRLQAAQVEPSQQS